MRKASGVAPWAAVMLDYTVDVALFAMASAGYINFFFPQFREFQTNLGPFHEVNLIWLGETLVLILLLALLNIKGIRESSLFNEVLGALDLVMESSIILIGFAFAWRPELFLHQWQTQFPSLHQLLYGVSIAVISYVGLESVSQAAQETIRPATVIPRTSLALIVIVLLFAMSFPTVSLGILPWQEIAAREGDPVARLAIQLPLVGFLAGPAAAVLAATIVLISANTGVMGASRLAYSMAELGLIGEGLSWVHPRFHTPVRSILFFSGVAAAEAVFAFLSGRRALETMANMYAFGAMLAYFLSTIALLALRVKEPHVPPALSGAAEHPLGRGGDPRSGDPGGDRDRVDGAGGAVDPRYRAGGRARLGGAVGAVLCVVSKANREARVGESGSRLGRAAASHPGGDRGMGSAGTFPYRAGAPTTIATGGVRG